MFDLEIYQIVNILGFIIGLSFGAIAQKNQFCFSGSIKDYVLIKSTKRGASVVMAMIIAIIASTVASKIFDFDLTQTYYYRENVNYFAIILGGLMFGVGMMIADGCSNRHLIKFGQGDSRSLITLIFIAIFAYATTKGYLNGYFAPIINNQTLIKWSSVIENIPMNIYIVIGILFIILYLLTKKLKRIFTLVDGFLIGLLVATAWSVTAILGEESLERVINLSGITFVYPTAQTLEIFMFYQVSELSFAISLVIGVILGTFAMSFVNKKYSFGCTASQKINRVTYNMIGGALMGTGGIMSIGCTVGQGLTGMSTLAFSSAVAIVSIFISAYITALILNKQEKLPMCFIFEWKDKDSQDYQI